MDHRGAVSDQVGEAYGRGDGRLGFFLDHNFQHIVEVKVDEIGATESYDLPNPAPLALDLLTLS